MKTKKKRIFRVFLPLGAAFLLLILSFFDFKTLTLIGETTILKFSVAVIIAGISLILLFYLLKHFLGLKIAAIIIYILAFSPLIIQNLPANNIRYTISTIAQMSETAEPIIIKNDATRLIATIYSSTTNPILANETEIPKESEKFWIIDAENTNGSDQEINFLSDGYHTAIELEKTKQK